MIGALYRYMSEADPRHAAIDTANAVEDVGLFPGRRLHRLKGNPAVYWSVTVSGNWRVIFRFDEGDAFDLDLVDYH